MSRREFYTIEESDVQFNINKKGWYLKGWSRAGLKTGFLLYPFKILFDCGIYTSVKPDIIFLTHQHTDHTQAIAHICTRHKPNVSTIYLPEPSIKFISRYERAISELSNPESEKMTDDEILKHQNIKLIPANPTVNPPANPFVNPFVNPSANPPAIPTDLINLNVIGQELQVEVLKAYHDVQSNGYGFSSWKKNIKPEYEYLIMDLTDEEKLNLSLEEQKIIKSEKINKIKELKKNQIDMYEKILNPEFAFYCDSTIENLSKHDEWKKYPVIICECTGLDTTKLNGDRDYDENHTSLNTLKPIMLNNKNKKWFLIHVSLACGKELIEQIELNLIKEGIDVKICV